MSALKSVIGSEPHGGRLVSRYVEREDDRKRLQVEAKELPSLDVSTATVQDLEMLATGGYSPITGFMDRADYRSVLHEKRLANGLPWTIPILLNCSEEEAEKIDEGEDVALLDPAGGPCATLELEEKYHLDKREYMKHVFGTTDSNHPGVQRVTGAGEVALAGDITLLRRINHCDFKDYCLTPRDAREIFDEKGWDTVVGFQTRNAVHRAHEYIQKCALEIVDGLFIHPLIGLTKDSDFDPLLRLQSYEALIGNYLPGSRTVLATLLAPMRYAGPREAILHVLIRKNFGCTHFIVGRDHAGVGDFYPKYGAQRLFEEYDRSELGIEPLFFKYAFHCRKCEGMATEKTCPHDDVYREAPSGTRIRNLLKEGREIPHEIMRPEVSSLLQEKASFANGDPVA
ncbi:MAG: Sulfate adenylyltransferase [Methanonatronarchaeales archaeon]|nr:Sulfate adenylyltransferase [Methanonatronarchaeales archaeon]